MNTSGRGALLRRRGIMRDFFRKLNGMLRVTASACPSRGCRGGLTADGSGCVRCGGSGVFFRLP